MGREAAILEYDGEMSKIMDEYLSVLDILALPSKNSKLRK